MLRRLSDPFGCQAFGCVLVAALKRLVRFSEERVKRRATIVDGGSGLLIGIGLVVVAALLILWEPLRFAREALIVLPTIGDRGALPAFELVAHGVVAAVCAAAGFALWNSSPDARKLAALAIAAAVVRAIQSLYWSALPTDTVPGDEPLIAVVAVVAGAGALAVLSRAKARQA
jgi:hypothetical protein